MIFNKLLIASLLLSITKINCKTNIVEALRPRRKFAIGFCVDTSESIRINNAFGQEIRFVKSIYEKVSDEVNKGEFIKIVIYNNKVAYN